MVWVIMTENRNQTYVLIANLNVVQME